MGLADQLGLGVVLTLRDKMSRNAARMNQSMAGLRRNATGMSDSFERNMSRMMASMNTFRTGMKVGFGITAAGAVLAAPIALSVKAAAGMEQQFGLLNSLSIAQGSTSKESIKISRDLQDVILKTAENSIKPLERMTEAMYNLQSAFGAVGAEAALPIVVDLSIAGKGSVQDASSLIKILRNNFLNVLPEGTESEKIRAGANITAGVIGALATDLPSLAQGAKTAAATAIQLNVSVEDLFTTLGFLNTKGLTPELSGTAFKTGLLSIVKLQKDIKDGLKSSGSGSFEGLVSGGFGENSDLFKKVGPLASINIIDAMGDLLPMVDVLKEVKRATDEIQGSAAKTNALEAAFGREGAQLFGLLIDNIDEFVVVREQIGGREFLKPMVDAIEGNAIGAMQKLFNKVNSLQIKLGQDFLPVVKDAFDWMGKLTQSAIDFIDVNPDKKKWISSIGLIGGGLTSVIGTLITGIFWLRMFQAQSALASMAGQAVGLKAAMFALGNTTVVLGARLVAMAVVQRIVTAAQWLWNIAMNANPIGLIITGVAALATGVYFLVENWDAVTEAVMGAWTWFKELLGKAPDWLLALVFPLGLVIKHWGDIKEAAMKAFNFIVDSPAFKLIAGVFEKVKSGISSVLGSLGLSGDSGPEIVSETARRGADMVVNPSGRDFDLSGNLSGDVSVGGPSDNRNFSTQKIFITQQQGESTEDLARRVARRQQQVAFMGSGGIG